MYHITERRCSLVALFSVVDVWTLAFSVDSRYLATGSHNGKINLFSVEEARKQTALDTRGKFIMNIAYVSNSPHSNSS